MSAALAVLTLLSAAPGALPEVRYTTTVVTRSWEPIALAEVERMVDEAVKEPLTARGKVRLVSAAPTELAAGAYTLRIAGRFVEEAERLTVYLSFGPGTKGDLPSLVAADTTEALGRKSRAEMERRIRASARRAAAQLADALAPWLDATRIEVLSPAPGDALPMSWGDIDVPPVRDRSEQVRTLMNPRAENNARAKALDAIAGYVFDQQAARNAVEHCVLRDPTPDIRARCVKALAPKARAHVPTQRILLHALRTDVDEKVLDALVKVSKGFVGLSRLETVATWLHMVASDATPTRAAEKVARLVAKEKDVPNLEFAVSACLLQQAVVYGKRHACAQGLLRRVAPERRAKVAWRYLTEASVFGSGERLTYEQVLRSVMEDRKHPPSPRLGALMLDLSERPATGRMRFKTVHLAGEHAPATEQSIARLLTLAHEPRLASGAIKAAARIARRAPDLAPATLAALDRLAAKRPWYPRPHRANPYEDLERSKKRLERLIEKGK